MTKGGRADPEIVEALFNRMRQRGPDPETTTLGTFIDVWVEADGWTRKNIAASDARVKEALIKRDETVVASNH